MFYSIIVRVCWVGCPKFFNFTVGLSFFLFCPMHKQMRRRLVEGSMCGFLLEFLSRFRMIPILNVSTYVTVLPGHVNFKHGKWRKIWFSFFLHFFLWLEITICSINALSYERVLNIFFIFLCNYLPVSLFLYLYTITFILFYNYVWPIGK